MQIPSLPLTVHSTAQYYPKLGFQSKITLWSRGDIRGPPRPSHRPRNVARATPGLWGRARVDAGPHSLFQICSYLAPDLVREGKIQSAKSVHLTETVQKLLFDQTMVQYELKSVEVEIRTIEISSLLCGIHRGRLDNVMKDHISKLLPKKISKNIFKNFEIFREIFSFFRFRKSENFQIFDFFHFRIENFQI